ncbi:MAG: hypothetical protein RL318_2619 [Fibrobacterota bacterium]|jgi:hypothetical protein
MKLCESRTRLSVLAAAVLGAATLGQAYDEDHAQAHLQPFFGFYAGAYQNNLDDLKAMIPGKNDDFLPVVPNAGLTLGAAYDRFHVGLSVGYQMVNSGDLTAAEAAANARSIPTYSFVATAPDTTKKWTMTGVDSYNYFRTYNYDLIPVEAFMDITMFKNTSAINFLIGGSAGIASMSLIQPTPVYGFVVGDTTKYILGTGGRNGADREALFLYSAYLGARINIADRLNLQGSVGWRGAFTDEVYFSDCDCYEMTTDIQKIETDESGQPKKIYITPTRSYRIDLSGVFVRADLRWTFASMAEKDADRATMRRQDLQEANIASAYRLR